MQVFLVFKNADFTEGRGPMYFDKGFLYENVAAAYIMSQGGIYGSRQEESTRDAHLTPNGRVRVFNGYDLREVEVDESTAPVMSEVAKVLASGNIDALAALLIRTVKQDPDGSHTRKILEELLTP